MHVNNDKELVVARLKEKMLDIAKQDIYSNLSSNELFGGHDRTHRLSVPLGTGTAHHFGEFQLHLEAFFHLVQDE